MKTTKIILCTFAMLILGACSSTNWSITGLLGLFRNWTM